LVHPEFIWIHLPGLLPHDIMEIFSNEPHYSPETETGAVFHLLGTLSQYGKVGVTCIGDSEEQAAQIYKDTIALLDSIADETQSLMKQYLK
jgi:hypothetical protein